MGGELDWKSGLIAQAAENEPDWKTGVPAPKANTDPLRGAAEATSISARTPSIWERVMDAITAHIPIAHPEQFTTREAAPMSVVPDISAGMTPLEREEHPIATAIGQFGSSLGSPGNAFLIAATAGAGEIPAIARGMGLAPKAASLLPRLMSLGFSAQMLKGAYDNYEPFKKAMDSGDENAALYYFTTGTLSAAAGVYAGQHGVAVKPEAGIKVGNTELNFEDAKYVHDIARDYMADSAKVGDHGGVQDSLRVIAQMLEDRKVAEHAGTPIEPAKADIYAREGEPVGRPVSPTPAEIIAARPTPQLGEADIRANLGVTGGEGPVGATPNISTVIAGNGGVAPEGQLALLLNPELAKKAISIPESPEQAIPVGGSRVSGAITNGINGALTAEEAGSIVSRLEGKDGFPNPRAVEIRPGQFEVHWGEDMPWRVAANNVPTPEWARLSGQALGYQPEAVSNMVNALGGHTEEQLSQSVGELQALVPEYTRAVGGAEGRAPSQAGEVPQGAGALPPLQAGESPVNDPPVISEAGDRDLTDNHGVTIVKPGRDMWWTGRFLGDLQESARRLNLEGHPLGPMLVKMTGLMSDVTKAIAVNSRDLANIVYNHMYGIVSQGEWEKMVIPMMEDRNISLVNRPAHIPDPALFSDSNGHWDPRAFRDNFPNATPRQEAEARTWSAYSVAKDLMESERVGLRDARRNESIAAGRTTVDANGKRLSPLETAIKYYPDDWGIENYYPHGHPGTWAIARLAGVDPKGNEIWEPIEDPKDDTIRWRQESEWDAKKTVERYLANNPNETVRVRQDTVSAMGKGISDRSRLIDMVEKVRDASTRIVHGGNADQIMDQLYDESAAAAYGPRRIANRQFGPVMERETSLTNFVKDKDSFVSHLLAGERYQQLAPALQTIMKMRNQIAELAGLSPTQRVSEFPRLDKYYEGYQYGNILARVDSSIEGLMGHPGLAEKVGRYYLNQHGLDPNLLNNFSGPVKQLWAVAKLGFDPKRILSHGLQSLWGVWPALGGNPLHFAYGFDHAYDMKYDWLIHDLNVAHGPTSSDVDFGNYLGAYFGRESAPLDWAKGSLAFTAEKSLYPFTQGIEGARRIAAIGGYKQALDRGMSPEAARDYARDVMDRATGNYTAANNAPFLRQLPGPTAQFKNFMLKTGQFVYGLRGWEIPTFMAAMGAIGFASLPFLRSISDTVKSASGGRADLDNYLKKNYPVASRGMFGVAGVDVPSGVGLGDISPIRENTPLGGLAGPFASDVLALGGAAAERVFTGPSRTAQDALDNAIRNISPEARRWYDEGIRQASGKPELIDPRTGAVIVGNLTPQERAEMFAGLTPLRVAEERDIHEYIRNQVAAGKDTRGFFVDRLAELQVNLSHPGVSDADRMEIVRQTAMYMKEAQNYGVSSNLVKSVIQRAKEMQIERLHRDIKLAPKSQRLGAYQATKQFEGEQ